MLPSRHCCPYKHIYTQFAERLFPEEVMGPPREYSTQTMCAPLAVVLMARTPVPGRVKSRLADAIGPDAACAIYEAMARDTWHAMCSTGLPCYLATDGDGSSWLPGAAGVILQAPGGFGRRLAAVLDHLLHHGFKAALALAADTPHLGSAVLSQAVDAISRSDGALVTAPAEDGGLVLLGLNLPPAIDLESLPWESVSLDNALAELARKSALSVTRILPGSYDIDEIEDIQRLLSEPDEVQRNCPSTVAACRRVRLDTATTDT